MSDLESGYYWVSYHGMKPVIMEKDSYGWNGMGIEHELDLTGYTVLGKVSEWCNNEDTAALPLQSVRLSLIAFKRFWWGNREKADDIADNDIDRYLGNL